MSSNEKIFLITIFDEVWEYTEKELRGILTREAYELYFAVHRQGGTVSFGLGALASNDMLTEVFTGGIQY